MSYVLPQPHKCQRCDHVCSYGPRDKHDAPVLADGTPCCPKCWDNFLRGSIGLMTNLTFPPAKPPVKAKLDVVAMAGQAVKMGDGFIDEARDRCLPCRECKSAAAAMEGNEFCDCTPCDCVCHVKYALQLACEELIKRGVEP